MNYLTYPRVLNMLQAALCGAQTINGVLLMQHGNAVITASVAAFIASVQLYLHLEGIQVVPPGSK